MATTTNYGWETPDDTDLVKDGALAQRTTASAIDSSLFSITNGKNVGLVHINTTTFTGQSSIRLDNIFTSSFDNYRVIFTLSSCSATNNVIYMRFVDGTTPTSASAFYYGATGLGATGGAASSSGFAQPDVLVNRIDTGAADIPQFTMDITRPNLAVRTGFLWSAYNYNGSGTFSYVGAGEWDLSTQFEGLYLYPGAGTFGGTVRVYGYRNS